jgi:integrase
VFTDSRGGPLRKRNLLRRWFHPLVAKAGLPRMRFHDLRHAHASLLLSASVHPKVVQERLGHSQVSVTLDTYSHVAPSLQREAAGRIDRLLAGAPRG